MVSMADIDEVEGWLIDQALGDCQMVQMFEALCGRLRECHVPIDRAVLSWATLHPLIEAEVVRWERGADLQHDQYEHADEETEDWLQSPIRYVLVNDENKLRRRITGGNAVLDFPMLTELSERGFTDYLILATEFGLPAIRNDLGKSGIVVSWSTKEDAGFSDDAVKALEYIQKRLAIVARATVEGQISRNIAETYLGRFAGSKVLSGQIRHGDGETIQAVIYYSDMRDSTAIAEHLGPDSYLKWLNEYFAATAGAVLDNGGEVLDFIGDAVLGVFPIASNDLKGSVEQSVAAVEETRKRLTAVDSGLANGRRMKAGIALSVGEVMFGNIGVANRLTFSVIGQTVHAAARVEALTKSIGTDVLMTEDVAALVPDRNILAGNFELDGFASRQPLYTLP